MKTTPNHGLSYVEGNDRPADYPLISQENMTKLDTLIQQLIDGKAPLSHNHSIGQIMGLTEDLAAKADQQATATALAGKAPTSHTHTMDGITGLTAALAAKANQAAVDTALAQKANTSHTHTQGDITGLTAALAGKAPTSHTHTMGQVTGLDTALAGKANTSTLDARVPSTMALRLDTTVGTRIFAGNTMIHGDTGWRDISGYLVPGMVVSGNFGRARMRRFGNRIEFDLKVDVSITGLTAIFDGIPIGYRPIQRFPMDNGIFTHPTTGAGASMLKAGGHPGVFYNTATPLQTGVSAPFPNPGTVAWTGSYATNDPWPSTLIGLPA